MHHGERLQSLDLGGLLHARIADAECQLDLDELGVQQGIESLAAIQRRQRVISQEAIVINTDEPQFRHLFQSAETFVSQPGAVAEERQHATGRVVNATQEQPFVLGALNSPGLQVGSLDPQSLEASNDAALGPTGNLGCCHRVPLDRDDLLDDPRLGGM